MVDRLNRSLRQPKRLAIGAVQRLEQGTWAGNVRALENAIGRSMLLCVHEVLEADDLVLEPVTNAPDQFDRLPTPSAGFSLETFLDSVRKQLLLKALDVTNGNQSQAARLLGITPQAVHKFVKKGEAGP